ncbi:phage tail fiber protein [Candidatus Termititenax aidoneus]|uniref:Phage tail fiber protein n=1 Tax=Termititenax aidoneus TaxID=2218524 RepID=A0A388TC67_TERA1|nr:phage tail fiber protein [Candidatus Termititenax aidoneus]
MAIAAGERMYASDINNLTFFPIGTILQFSGSEYTRLTNARTADNEVIWTLCNGIDVNGITVPNLVDKFLRGAASSGTVAGADSQSVTITSANLPAHTHGVGTLAMSGLTATELPVSGLSTAGLTISGQTISGLSISGLSADSGGAHLHSGTGTTNTGSGGHTHTASGNTTTGEGTHTHGVTDPGHTHTTPRETSEGGTGTFELGYPSAVATDTVSFLSTNTTDISITNENSSHSHTFSLSTPENGGIHAHDVNVSIPEGGSHSHTISGGTISGGTISGGTITGSITGGTVSGSIDAGAITGSTESAGSSAALTINTLPSYYTVVYIMKVA